MAQFQFRDFRFDTQTLSLRQNGKKLKVRPKTLLLLLTFLENREKIVTKKELFQRVWQTEYVQDHVLFQLVSEIRKLAPNCELIRTQPNQGYQWVAQTEVIVPRGKNFRMAVAASMIGICSCAYYFLPFSADIHSTTLTEHQFTIPAINGYAKGVVALEKGDAENAEKWLRFSLAENPASMDTHLLLAESLLLQNKLTASESIAQSVLQSPGLSSYSTSAAAELLSRIYQKQGSVYNALQYALIGSQQLDASQAVCTAEVFDSRIQNLSNMLDEQGMVSTANHGGTNLEDKKFSDFEQKHDIELRALIESESLPQCVQLKEIIIKDEISDCTTHNLSPHSANYFGAKYALRDNYLDLTGLI